MSARGNSTKNGMAYYPRYPRDFIEGTLGMPFEVKAAYGLVLDLIYMKRGQLPDDARFIAGMLGVSVRKWNSIRETLIDGGKLVVIDGFLTNYRAIIELESLSKYSEKQAENRRGKSKNKHLAEPPLNQSEPEPEPEYSVPYGTAAGKPGGLWDDGLKILKNSGLTDAKARAIIGDWCKRHGRDEVLSAVSAAGDAADPVAYVHTILKPKPSANVTLEDMERARAQSFRITDAGW